MTVFMVWAVCIIVTFGLVACGGGGGDDTPDTGGASTLTAQSTADITNCPSGGVALDYGIDDNKNGTLDASEIDGTEYICNGTTGLTALVTTSPADIANCPAGGTKIEIGIDANSNSVLDPGEIDQALTGYICNPTAPANTAPVADAGPDQTASTGFPVTLDGSGSSDADGPLTTYSWSFVMRPAGSTAVLSNPLAQKPTFTPDVKGVYVLSLSVSDGWLFSAPDYVMITPKTWGEAENIDRDTALVSYPQVGGDKDGNAIAVWEQNSNVYANIYNGTGWEGEVEIDVSAFVAKDPQVAFDGFGNAFVVWAQDGNIYAKRYDGRFGKWQPGAVTIHASNNAASDPQVAFDGKGNAIVVWRQSDGTYDNIYANHYDFTPNSWGTAKAIETSNSAAAIPQVGMDANGNAIAVWVQGSSIYANRYVSIGIFAGWGTAQLIETDTNSAFTPQVAVDANGNAFAVWEQNASIYANRYEAGTGWQWTGAPRSISAGIGWVANPQVGMDAEGNAVVVWVESDDTGTIASLYANRYETGWTGAVEIDAVTESGVDSDVNDYPSLAVDAYGNAIATWSQWDIASYSDQILSNRYDALSGTWTGVELIQEATDDAFRSKVAFDASGNATVVWIQRVGTVDDPCDLYATRFE